MLHQLGSFLLLSLTVATSFAAVSVKDDAMHTVTLTQPAQRIISLAPHATELLFEAGAAKASLPSAITATSPKQQKTCHPSAMCCDGYRTPTRD